MFDLSGKTALVTGGSRGIGRAIAVALASHGASVMVNYVRNAAAAEETVAALRALGVRAEAVQGDVAVPEEAVRIVQTAVEAFGRLDILVNNAGVTHDDLVLRLDQDDWDLVLNTNLRGAFFCTKTALRGMIRQRWGRIINVTSVAGLVGNAGQANYSAAKAGIIGFTKAVAKEVANRNITVNSIAPGFVETEMTRDLTEQQREAILRQIPAGRTGRPEDVAPAAVFLASEEAAYVNGHVLTVDGGLVSY
ncbi:MAG TPA: 3-oxoacyl-[acyl-carrier-protein] reductase [Dehalococcoidia bacterium]|nr:3-oxoacyl-[acyl-carrier-protein] reductase [Dehalococcoidia bacterium]